MPDGLFKLDISMPEIAGLAEDLREEAEEVLADAAHNLATTTYAHIIEQAQQKLHSSREKYIQAMSLEETSRGTWIIKLDKSAMWIEEGMDRHEMIDDIINGGSTASIAKDGSRYKRIPISINKPPNASTPSMREIQATVKRELKKAGISYGKLERDGNGKPKVGTLHRLNIMDKPIKTQNGVGQGHGPIGAVRQGTTGIPFLKGLTITQRNMAVVSGQNLPGGMYTRRDILTWRIISTRHKGTGKWIHPGVTAKKFFDEGYQWCSDTWERVVKPQVLESFQSR